MKICSVIFICILMITPSFIPTINSGSSFRGNILYVGGSGSGNFSSIQEAINSSSNEDMVYVYNGIYQEEIIVNKSLLLKGQSNINTIIYGGFKITVDNSTIENFRIIIGFEWNPDDEGKNGPYRTGIWCNSSHNFFSYNRINYISGVDALDVDYNAGDGGSGCGIYLINSGENNISQNNFSNINGGNGGNVLQKWTPGGNGGNGYGISLINSHNNKIFNNDFYSIDAGGGGKGHTYSNGHGGIGAGIYLEESNLNYVCSNSIKTIYGGKGATGEFNTGGTGGIGSAIHLVHAQFNQIKFVNVTEISGGKGGQGSSIYDGGRGGIGTGLFLDNSDENKINLFNISLVFGGAGGGSANYGYCTGGTGGISSGLYFKSSNSNTINSTIISSLHGGDAGEKIGFGNIGKDQESFGIYFEEDSFNNIISENNTLNSDKIIFKYNISSFIIQNLMLCNNSNPTNYGKIALIKCNNILVTNNTISNFSGSSESIENPGYLGSGISLIDSNSILIDENEISVVTGSLSCGIYLKNIGSCQVIGNYIHNITEIGSTSAGIYSVDISGTNISDNTINEIFSDSGDSHGVYIKDSLSNIIFNNSFFSLVEGFGIYLCNQSDLNTMYNNNFLGTFNRSYDECFNFWDGGSLVGGNYWQGHYCIGNPSDGSYPHQITGGINTDQYPYEKNNGWIINQIPVSSFTIEPSNPTTIDVLYFNSTSYDPDGLIVNWTWDMNDGIVHYGEKVTHQYKSAGEYNVILTVKDNGDGTNSTMQTVNVTQSFTLNPPMSFSATTYNHTQINLTWIKDANATHTYIERGINWKLFDSATGWTNPSLAINGDLSNYASTSYNATLTVFADAITNMIRVYASRWQWVPYPYGWWQRTEPAYLNITAYYDDDLHIIYHGSFTSNEYVIFDLGGLKELSYVNFTYLQHPEVPEMWGHWMNNVEYYRWQGTEIYNGTGGSFEDTGLDSDTTYCYRAWSYNETTGLTSASFAFANATTDENLAPFLSNVTPANNSDSQDLSVNWSVNISDPNGDMFNWSIECSNDQSDSGIDDTDGAKKISLTYLEFDTEYTVWVNATDMLGAETKEWFSFRTRQNSPPKSKNVNPANQSFDVAVDIDSWSVDIIDDDGDETSGTIKCSNGDFVRWDNQPNGTCILPLSSLEFNTNYTIWLNFTDGHFNVNETFWFVTEKCYILSLNIVGSGSVIKYPDQGCYTVGTMVELTANEDPGWSFSHWSGDLSSTVNPEIITMYGNMTVNVHFTLNGPFSLTVTSSGSGIGSIEANPSGPYYFGDMVTIWANASEGSLFAGFNGDLNGTDSPQMLFMDDDKHVDAQFDIIVNQQPVADFIFEPSIPKTGFLVYFNSTSYDPDGVIVNWTWNMSDSTILYGEQVTYQFNSSGIFEIELVILDDDGAYDSISKNITVRNNTCPMISKVYPVNNSLNVPRPVASFNISVFDDDGDLMTMFLRCFNHSGLFPVWEDLTCFMNVTNGSYENTLPVTTAWIWGNTTYTWSVNVTDGLFWTNETYSFTTSGSRYDVTNDNKVNYLDALTTWNYRTNNPSGYPYDGLYDVTNDGKINYMDALTVWAYRGE